MSCGPGETCVTCSDAAVAMLVESLDRSGLATCVGADGERAEVDVTLVDAVPGATVLVHAGVAIA